MQDKHEIPVSLYTIKWFLQCFLDRVPFQLTLRLWDIYILKGETVLLAQAYNLVKMHRSQCPLAIFPDFYDILSTELFFFRAAAEDEHGGDGDHTADGSGQELWL